jgi:hypothetical protein
LDGIVVFSLPRTAQRGVFKTMKLKVSRYFAGAAAFAASFGSRAGWLSGRFCLNEMLLAAEVLAFR